MRYLFFYDGFIHFLGSTFEFILIEIIGWLFLEYKIDHITDLPFNWLLVKSTRRKIILPLLPYLKFTKHNKHVVSKNRQFLLIKIFQFNNIFIDVKTTIHNFFFAILSNNRWPYVTEIESLIQVTLLVVKWGSVSYFPPPSYSSYAKCYYFDQDLWGMLIANALALFFSALSIIRGNHKGGKVDIRKK